MADFKTQKTGGAVRRALKGGNIKIRVGKQFQRNFQFSDNTAMRNSTAKKCCKWRVSDHPKAPVI